MTTPEELRKTEEGRAKCTETFLLKISSRLSGLTECYQLNYTVIIGSCSVVFLPPVLVCPNKHMRRSAAKIGIVEHIVRNDPELFDRVDEFGTVKIKSGVLVPGTYEYQSSINNRSRHWVRVR